MNARESCEIHMATDLPHCQCNSWTWVAACECLVDIDPIRMSKRLRVTLRDALCTLAAVKVPIMGKGSLHASAPLAGLAFIWTFATVKSPIKVFYHCNTFTLQYLWTEYHMPSQVTFRDSFWRVSRKQSDRIHISTEDKPSHARMLLTSEIQAWGRRQQ